MKNIAIINVVRDRSTGKIAQNLLTQLSQKGYNVTFFYGRGEKSTDKRVIRIDTPLEEKLHAIMARITGLQGSFSWCATKRMLRKINSLNIDTIILINPHAYYLNEKALFSYISKNNIRFVNIIPDEYAYLGKCAVSPVCDRYITGKGKCPNIHRYPKSWFFDTCPSIMRRKEQCYKQLKRAMFVGPGFVIDNLKKSYLGKYMPAAVLDEAIDIDMYQPRDSNALRLQLSVSEEKIVILCIAPPYKGIQYFKQVAEHFKEDERFVFIHVGRDEEVIKLKNYIHVGFVKENSDLAVYYSMADLFLFTSLADTMSNACLEALACGTPLLTFDVSGMPYLMDETVGTMVEPMNVDQLVSVVKRTKKKSQDVINRCRAYAENRYDMSRYADKIVEIVRLIS